MSRAYLRLDPALPENKAAYSDGQFRAFVETLALAETQHRRGRFKSLPVLKALLGPRGRHVAFLVKQGDIVVRGDGQAYVEGWDEWQEGDLTVQDRMRAVRQRRNGGEPIDLSPGARRTANWRLRTRIFERDSYTCRYCGRDDYPRDWLILEHVDPNGPSTEENLVTACRGCNKLKGGRTPEQAGMALLPVTRDTSHTVSHEVFG